MDALHDILADLAATLDVELQEGRSHVELSPEIVAQFLRPTKAGSASTRSQSHPSAMKTPPSPDHVRKKEKIFVEKRRNDAPGTLEAVATQIAACTRCGLHTTRTQTVPGTGRMQPEVMFIGEAPGADEDQQGLPFVGRAGKLLTKMIEAMGFTREEVFIANILKCRPPGNRMPTPEEMKLCMPFLLHQITLVKPSVIVGLGSTAVQGLLRTQAPIGQLRNHWHAFEGIPFMPTFHPSYLLRFPAAKRHAWADLQAVLKHLGRTPPPRSTATPTPA